MDIRWVGVPGVAALCAVLLSGCGSGGNALDAAATANLHNQVAAIRAAARAGNEAAAAKRLDELRATIQQLTGAHQLNAADGMTLLTQVDQIANGIAAQPTPTPTPAPTVAAKVPVPTPKTVSIPTAQHGKANGEGHGKAKGRDR